MHRRRTDEWHGGRTAVVVAGLAGAALWAQQLAGTEAAFYLATMRALVAGLVVLGALGLAHQVWLGAAVRQVGAGMAGVGVELRRPMTDHETVETVIARLEDALERLDVRVASLESTVRDDGPPLV